jgi:assimilatory nitrate reductase catalytic subunit
VSWDAALRDFVTRFQGVLRDHGPESVAFLSTGQICTEEMALLGCLWKFGMGALHCDSNTRQCMATAHVAYNQSFGFDAPPFTYADFEQSDTLVFIGANPCIAHPILWQRVLQNPHQPRILVIDPRRTETAAQATQHLALRPKSDLTLLYGLAHILVHNGWIDREFIARHTTGYGEFASFVRGFTPDRVAAEAGLTVGEVYRCAESIHRGRAVSFWWTMGVNQSHEAVRTAQAVINLALMTGNLGRPGTGANSITGQCNAMGSRLFSNTTSLVGGRDFTNAAHRLEVAESLGIPIDCIPSRNSLAYDQIVEAIRQGRIRALWVVATNPSHSWIGAGPEGLQDGGPRETPRRLRPTTGEGGRSELDAVLDRLEFLVVQDMYSTTATARRADLLLPAAGWGEKTGTFINSERRVGLIQQVSAAPGQALSDFRIFQLIAHYWGCGARFAGWSSPEAVFQILKRLSAGRPCDMTGIEGYEHLVRAGGIQWPWTRDEAARCGVRPPTPAVERRLFADGRFFTEDGRARFLFEAPRPVAEPADKAYPLVLLTGRGTSAQWHTNSRTGKSAILRSLYPAAAYVEVNPADARALRVAAGDQVVVASRRGTMSCQAVLTQAVQPGQVFIPMHYEGVNRLTCGTFDPYSRQPSFKHCAVRLEPHP